MAAVDPSESPKRQKSPVGEVETFGEKTEPCRPGCDLNETDKVAPAVAESPGGEQPGGAGKDGGCVTSHSEVSVEPGAGADKTTPEDPTSSEKTLPPNVEASGSEQRSFDWSESEDDEEDEAKTQSGENEKRVDLSHVTGGAEEVQQDQCVEANITSDVDADKTGVKENSSSGERSTEKEMAPDGIEDIVDDDDDDDDDDDEDDDDDDDDYNNEGEELDQEVEDDTTAKSENWGFKCKECGERFKRRETFNLHRHCHAQEDELTTLTCKECGLTFQHRSILIKHRNEHKVKEEQIVPAKKEACIKEQGRYECAECEKIFMTVDKLRLHNCSNSSDKPYHCPLCRREFHLKSSVTRHMVTHSRESVFACQDCDHIFTNNIALRNHQRSHAVLKPYECPECGMVFKHYSVMEDHRRKHTDGTRSHLCNICGKSFKYSSLLHQHQYLHTGQKPFNCPECGKRFAFAQNMKAHCRQHRLSKNNSLTCSEPSSKQAPVSEQEAVKRPGKENTNQSEEHKQSYSCPLCRENYDTPASLRTHMHIHETEYEKLDKSNRSPKEFNKNWDKGHTCPQCPSIFREATSLHMHVLSAHSSAQYLEQVKAAPIKQTFPISNDDVEAKEKNDGISIKSYKCPECGKMFRHRSVLELHMRIHSKDKPYQCKVCGKSFRFSSYLQQHLIIHTGKKPYKCPDCGKDFAFLQNMKTHQRLHQEKPFRCTSCRKGYSDEIQLQQHMLSHNGDKPHKCDLCDKSFGLAYLLRDHMNTHTGERPHRCEECHKTFSWFSSLLVHQKIHARKRQSFNQYNSLPAGMKMRGRGSRGRRGSRLSWGWSRPLGGSTIVTSNPTYPVSAVRDAELDRRAIQPPSPVVPSHVDVQARQQKEQWPTKKPSVPVQWKVDGGEVMPIASSHQPHLTPQHTQFESSSQPGPQQHHQRTSGWAESASICQTGPKSIQSLESAQMKNSVVSSLPAVVPKKSSPSAVNELEQHRQQKLVAWSSTTTSTAVPSVSSLQREFTVPATYVDGAALWSIRPTPLPVSSHNSPNKLGQELQLCRWPNAPMPAPMEPSAPPKKDNRLWDINNPQVMPSTVNQLEKPWNGCETQKQWVSGLASTSAQIDQSSAMPVSTSVSLGLSSTLWDLPPPPGIPKTISPSEKLIVNHDFQLQQKQVSPSWVSVQSHTSSHKVPISLQYEPHRFAQGIGAPIWGFQSNPVGPQTLLTGQLKPGNGQELHQQPMVTGTQIILNQPSPFFSPPLPRLPPLALPGPHPLHSVAVGALSRPPHPNIFFTPQAVMNERPHMPQTLPLPQLAPRTETHKLGPRLPFAPERLLQCMICGCSFPTELNLQMHYLQHAQGEI